MREIQTVSNSNLLAENDDRYVTDISIDINSLRESREKLGQPDLSKTVQPKQVNKRLSGNKLLHDGKQINRNRTHRLTEDFKSSF